MAETSTRLKNDDFRRLLATPSNNSTTSGSAASVQAEQKPSHQFTHRQTSAAASKPSKKGGKNWPPNAAAHVTKEKRDKDNIFDESQARLNEILNKYRDRAAERRKGMVPEDEDLRNRLAAAYKSASGALAPISSTTIERRKLEIHESKYLGGDIEHTHLVKGLDYSLLNKIKSELETQEKDKQLEEALEQEKQSQQPPVKQANTKLAKNVCQMLFDHKLPTRNELFARGRMAYVVEFDDELESDVPATLLRSVQECPADQSTESINADNVLINKLTQILAYLRADTKKRKKGGLVDREEVSLRQQENQKIYEEASEYVKRAADDERKGRRDRDKLSDKPKSYFDAKDRGGRDGDDRDRRERDRYDRDRERDKQRDRDRERGRDDRDRRAGGRGVAEDIRKRELMDTDDIGNETLERLKKRRMELEADEAYAEFYPGGIGMFDAGGDSDDEAVDYSKMDMGNRKGPIKRWDFDNEEDYERYQGQREAMPKAAYQFGVKMNAGRKTRKSVAAASEKKIDRELEKINRILDARQATGGAPKNKINY